MNSSRQRRSRSSPPDPARTAERLRRGITNEGILAHVRIGFIGRDGSVTVITIDVGFAEMIRHVVGIVDGVDGLAGKATDLLSFTVGWRQDVPLGSTRVDTVPFLPQFLA